MIKTDGSEPAFAAMAISNLEHRGQDGLTKREYFAAMALQGLLANSANLEATLEMDARSAVRVADYLIKKLNTEEKPK